MWCVAVLYKGRFPYNRFYRKDRLCRFKFLEATGTIIWKRSSQTTEAILAIETILAYGSSEIELPLLRRAFPYNRLCRFKFFEATETNLTTQTIIWKPAQRRSLPQKRFYGNRPLRWLETVSWRARPGPLNSATKSRLMHAKIELKMKYVACTRACAPGSRMRK